MSDLRDFLAQLEARGELKRITHAIDAADVGSFLNLVKQDAVGGLSAEILGDFAGNYQVTQSGTSITVERTVLAGGGFTASAASSRVTIPLSTSFIRGTFSRTRPT